MLPLPVPNLQRERPGQEGGPSTLPLPDPKRHPGEGAWLVNTRVTRQLLPISQTPGGVGLQ